MSARTRWHLSQVPLLLLATLACFAPGLTGGFLFDDFPNLVRDPAWKMTSLSWQQIREALQAGTSSAAGRPFALLSFAFNHLLTGMDPWWLKATNVAWHAGNGWLLWQLVRRLFALLPAERPRIGAWAACLLALGWLIHPLQVSTVLYVVQRMEVGAATGVLLFLLSYLHARSLQLEGRVAWPWLLASLLCLLLGLGFKETAALGPGYAFLIEICLLKFRTTSPRRSRAWLSAYAFAGVCAVFFALQIAMPSLQVDPTANTRMFGPWERLLTQGPVLTMYLQQAFAPLPSTLHFHYDNFVVSHGWWTPPATLLAWAGLAALATFAVVVRRCWPLTTLGIGWFFVGHALTSNVILLELAFEHRNYMPLFGVLLALVQPMSALGARLNSDTRAVLGALPVLALGALCTLHAASWGSPLTLAWTQENTNPTSQRASYSLAQQLIRESRGDQTSPLWSMGEQQMAAAAALPGPSALPLQGLVLLQSQSGKPVSDVTWLQLAQRLTERPASVETKGALHALVACEINRRCTDSPSELPSILDAVVVRNPNDATVRTIAANHAWNVMQDKAKAIRLQREAAGLSAELGHDFALVQFLLASEDAFLVHEGRTRGLALAEGGHLPAQDEAKLRRLISVRNGPH